ncbi:MAG: CdaR family protein, partial [Candidatus Binataceae bacterium]
VSPSQIVLDIDRIVTRTLPVHLVTSGAADGGYHVTAAEVNPRVATIKGPSRQITQIGALATEAIDLSGATSNLSRVVALTAPPGATRIDPPEVAVTIAVSEVVADKEFPAVPVHVRNSAYAWKVEPVHINVTVRGPLLTLARVNLANAVVIDADGMAPGSYAMPVRVELPQGVELVHQSAEKVRLKMFRHRRSASG